MLILVSVRESALGGSRFMLEGIRIYVSRVGISNRPLE